MRQGQVKNTRKGKDREQEEMCEMHEQIELLQYERKINSHLENIYQAQSEYMKVLEKCNRNIQEKLMSEKEKNNMLENNLRDAQLKIMDNLANKRAAGIVQQEREWRRRQRTHGCGMGGYAEYSCNQVEADGEESEILDEVGQPVASLMEKYRNLPETKESIDISFP